MHTGNDDDDFGDFSSSKGQTVEKKNIATCSCVSSPGLLLCLLSRNSYVLAGLDGELCVDDDDGGGGG